MALAWNSFKAYNRASSRMVETMSASSVDNVTLIPSLIFSVESNKVAKASTPPSKNVVQPFFGEEGRGVPDLEDRSLHLLLLFSIGGGIISPLWVDASVIVMPELPLTFFFSSSTLFLLNSRNKSLLVEPEVVMISTMTSRYYNKLTTGWPRSNNWIYIPKRSLSECDNLHTLMIFLEVSFMDNWSKYDSTWWSSRKRLVLSQTRYWVGFLVE